MKIVASGWLRWLKGRPATRPGTLPWAKRSVWATFTVAPRDLAEAIADRLMAHAVRPENAGRIGDGVSVVRVVRDHSEQYYFSPAAGAIFEPLLEQHRAHGCPPPEKIGRGGYFRLYCGYIAVWVPWDGRYPLPSVKD